RCRRCRALPMLLHALLCTQEMTLSWNTQRGGTHPLKSIEDFTAHIEPTCGVSTAQELVGQSRARLYKQRGILEAMRHPNDPLDLRLAVDIVPAQAMEPRLGEEGDLEARCIVGGARLMQGVTDLTIGDCEVRRHRSTWLAKRFGYV